MLYSATDWCKARESRCQNLRAANNIITNVVFMVYPVLIIYTLMALRPGAVKMILIPGISFVIVTLLRDKIDAPRPYQVYGIAPIIPKDTIGNSFPSRHAFSIFMIAMTGLYVDAYLGIILMLMGAALCLIRVVGGVHFIKDVVCGALIGIVIGLLYFVI